MEFLQIAQAFDTCQVALQSRRGLKTLNRRIDVLKENFQKE